MGIRASHLSDSRLEVRFCPLGVSQLALCSFRQKWGSWSSEWISENSHQSRHSTGTASFTAYIVVCTASLKEKENTTTMDTMAGQLSSRPIIVTIAQCNTLVARCSRQQIGFLSHWDPYAVISLEAVAYS